MYLLIIILGAFRVTIIFVLVDWRLVWLGLLFLYVQPSNKGGFSISQHYQQALFTAPVAFDIFYDHIMKMEVLLITSHYDYFNKSVVIQP